MPKKDPRIDAYIARASDFAKPILTQVRKLVHATCPNATETIKWNSPFFEHKGILLATPAFKRHCAVIFWKGKLILDKDERTRLRRLTSLAELPDDRILAGYIKKAVNLNDAGVKSPVQRASKAKKPVVLPDALLTALKKNKEALTVFENFSPSHKREYVQWITEAKRDETRAKRIKAAIQQMTEGKSRNWKYQ